MSNSGDYCGQRWYRSMMVPGDSLRKQQKREDAARRAHIGADRSLQFLASPPMRPLGTPPPSPRPLASHPVGGGWVLEFVSSIVKVVPVAWFELVSMGVELLALGSP